MVIGLVSTSLTYEGYRGQEYKDTLVPGKGIEPPLSFLNQILSLARLPVPPPRHEGVQV